MITDMAGHLPQMSRSCRLNTHSLVAVASYVLVAEYLPQNAPVFGRGFLDLDSDARDGARTLGELSLPLASAMAAGPDEQRPERDFDEQHGYPLPPHGARASPV
jgi:hypothetical protein